MWRASYMPPDAAIELRLLLRRRADAQRRASRVVMQMRDLQNGKVMYRVTVLAGAQTESLEFWDVPEESIPAVGSQVNLLVYVRAYVDRSKMAPYSLGLGTSPGDF